MSLDSTLGGATAESYASVAYADTYHGLRLGSGTVWSGASTATKEAALRQAAELIDQNFEFEGVPTDDLQALRWPREDVLKRDGHEYYENDELPVNLLKAQCELALYIVTNSGYTGEVNDLDRLRVSSISITFDDASGGAAFPQIVLDLMRGLGDFCGKSRGGASTAKLSRV